MGLLKKMKSVILKNRKTSTNSDPVTSGSYEMRTNMKLVKSNVYAQRCVQDMVETAFGKPFSGGDIVDLETINRTAKDYLKCGNGFMELVVFDSKPLSLYHIPAQTMQVVKNVKGKRTYKQNGDDETVYEEYTKDVWQSDSVISGIKKSYIIHILNYEDDPDYGVPVWIPAKLKIKQSASADEFIDSFYEDDAIPKGALLTKGAELDDDGEDDLASMLEGRNKGARNRRNLLHIHMDEESDMKYLPFNDNIVDGPFILLQRDNRVDVCVAFGVPPKRLGLESTGKLGGGNEYTVQLTGYYDDIITPLQVKFETKLEFCNIKFKRPIAAGQTQKKKASISELAKLRSELLESE